MCITMTMTMIYRYNYPTRQPTMEQESMEMDQIGTRPILPPSEFDFMSICPNITVCPDPVLEIDSVSMEPGNVIVVSAQAIVPRGGLNFIIDCSEMVQSRYGGHNTPTALTPSSNSQAFFPLIHSEDIVPGRTDDQADRAQKRYRIDYE